VDAYQNRQVWVDNLPRYAATTALVGSEAHTVMLIGCLTSAKDDLDQWRRYGGNTQGCVIGIDAQFLEKSAGVTIRQIRYGPDDLITFVNSGLLMLQTHYEESPDDMSSLQELASFFVADLFAFKHPAFASENEIRISRMLCIDENTEHGIRDPGGHGLDGALLEPLPVKIRDGTFGPTRYVELPLSFPDGRSAIRSFGFGPSYPNSAKAAFEELNATTHEPAELWQSVIPYRN